MTDENKIFNSNLIDIPKIFKSDLTGDFLGDCINCEKHLLDIDEPYLIEKALKTVHGYHSYSTIFEYAMCITCKEKLEGELSKESLQNMSSYFEENIHLEKRREEKMESRDMNVDSWISQCVITGKSVYEIGECQIMAQCQGEKLLFYYLPLMISGTAMDEIAQLISNETLEELNRFKDKLTGGPPELEELLKVRTRIFI